MNIENIVLIILLLIFCTTLISFLKTINKRYKISKKEKNTIIHKTIVTSPVEEIKGGVVFPS